MNLLFVPTSVIYAAFRLPNLRDLSIRSITVSYGISDISTTQSLAELTRLELRGIYYAAVFDGLLLPSLSSPLTWSPQDPPINFSCLKMLVVSLSKYADELNIMWNLIQCVAPSLESLVLEDYTSHGAEGLYYFDLAFSPPYANSNSTRSLITQYPRLPSSRF
ncbi:hypothetical protein CPB84DRAFT_1853303 [Gymnopilus junonius]|uniref:Uncharacterized protein n=1 Tax=Gymnopilus junonius TaxID=109634 RepID=A0A9P5TFR7_GYMJU|nr:hypothetical protein CPB84DRAFT_1853303 [Gymnopilus junonius]